MKLLLLAILVLAACGKPQPEFYIDGKPYRTVETCIEDAYINDTLTCIEYRTDTIPCK